MEDEETATETATVSFPEYSNSNRPALFSAFIL